MDLGVEEVNPAPHPGWISVFRQLMKLRVIVLLQVTAICAILVHDLVTELERTWLIQGTQSWSPSLEVRSLQVDQTPSTCGTMLILTL